MSNISKLRDAADLLLNLGKYDEAYDIYDEVYSQIWGALGTVQSGLSEFSFGFLTHNIRPSIEFRNQYLEPAVNTVFVKWFNLDIDQTLNEFIFTVYGHLQCICYSQILISKYTSAAVLSEFVILYNLIHHSADEKWVSYLLRIVSPIIDGNRLKKIRFNLPEDVLHRQFLHLAEKIRHTDWNALNQFALQYIERAGEKNSHLYKSLTHIAGVSAGYQKSHNKKNDKKAGAQEKKQTYEKYERYEKYEKYEKFEKQQKASDSVFDPTTATDDEKIKYYGSVLGLKGKVTKSDIRKRYLEEIGKYHPDKVQNLGVEILEFAEKKTKEINVAYDWLKLKFNL